MVMGISRRHRAMPTVGTGAIGNDGAKPTTIRRAVIVRDLGEVEVNQVPATGATTLPGLGGWQHGRRERKAV